VGVRGETTTGVAVLGRIFGPGGLAGLFAGGVKVDGDLSVTGDVILTNRDLAERFPVVEACSTAPGTVMVIGSNGNLMPCRQAYDKRAIGIISGAGPFRAAITLGADADSQSSAPIAMVGTAFCRVDARYAPIEVGDLLTSSETSGHAMKAGDAERSFGTIIGKALAALPDGCGLIPMVVSLQ
jgi:hypothetical protein